METIETKAPVLFEIDLRDTGSGRNDSVPVRIEFERDPPQRYLSRAILLTSNIRTTITTEQDTDKFNGLREHYRNNDAPVRLILHLPMSPIRSRYEYVPEASLDIEGQIYSVAWNDTNENVTALCIWGKQSPLQHQTDDWDSPHSAESESKEGEEGEQTETVSPSYEDLVSRIESLERYIYSQDD